MNVLHPTTSSRPICARIFPEALRHNYRLCKEKAPDSRAWAVIKADAYGHGQLRVAQALREVADGFALLECENALALREAGFKHPLLLLEGVFNEADARHVVTHDLHTAVHCVEQIEMLAAHATAEHTLNLHLKINSGMNRLGFDEHSLARAWASLEKIPSLNLSLMTHFANADDALGVKWQLARFRLLAGVWRGPVSLGNSAAILRHPEAHGDWVRPGIMLYGASPFADQLGESMGLQPAMALESRIIGVQHLAPGERVGYGGLFTAEQPMRIGIVACGYADGYPRSAPTGTPIAVAGRMSRTLGRVSMDMLACDLSHIPEAGLASPVTLWGPGEAGKVPAEAVAAAAGTIAYELFCALSPRVPVVLAAEESSC
ncbi:alanine racemase [Azonexus sp.]|uniref:alanine racemase n=1 Tax=Azonexus sp. TaxID=1872668 RepID=UPI0039E54FC7